MKARLQRPVSTVAIAPTIFDLAKIPYESSGFSGEPLRSVWEAAPSQRTPPEHTHMMLAFKAPWVEVEKNPGDREFEHYPEESLAEWHERLGLTR